MSNQLTTTSALAQTIAAIGTSAVLALAGCSRDAGNTPSQSSPSPTHTEATAAAPTSSEPAPTEPASSESPPSDSHPQRSSLATSASRAALPSLLGTHWQLLSLSEVGQPYENAQNPADVEFNADGTWGVLHYGGMLQGGKYTVRGNQLTMNSEDGTEYMAGAMEWDSQPGVIAIKSSEWVMRLGPQK